jgi:glycosyltransferase involved in cell wall biosynthesis
VRQRQETDPMNRTVAVFHMLPSGGGIRVAGQFASGLSGRYDVQIHRPEGGVPLCRNRKMSETVYPYPLWRKPTGAMRTLAPVSLVIRLLSFKKICRSIADNINSSADIALIHNAMPVAASPILNYLKVPSLYFCYEYPRHIYEKQTVRRTTSRLADIALKPLEFLEKRIDAKSTENTQRIATLSTYMQGRIQSIYGRNSDVVPAGVDTGFFSPDPSVDRNSFVLSVGALWPFKGHETAIRIVSLISEKTRPSLRIIADREFPGYSEYLCGLANELSVKLIVTRGISNTELRYLYLSAQAVLCCQKLEPYGLVPLEAMACNTPVIARAEGGFIDNIVHGETGFLFDGTADSGAEMLAKVLNSRDSCSNMTQRAFDFVSSKRTLQSGIQLLIEALELL